MQGYEQLKKYEIDFDSETTQRRLQSQHANKTMQLSILQHQQPQFKQRQAEEQYI